MPDGHMELEIAYTDTVIEQAATSFVRHFFKTAHGRALMVACVVNVAAFLLTVYFGVNGPFMLFVVGLIAALGPTYLALVYFLYPRKFSDGLKRRLQPRALVTINPAGFGIAANGRAFALPWSDVKSILEFPEYFVLVLSPFAFGVIPKGNLPVVIQQVVRDASRPRAA